MPYVKQDIRQEIFGTETSRLPKDAGELNYVFTTLALLYLSGTDKKYADYNEIIGVLECVKQEFYRRAVTPYEDIKSEENGDVYDN